MVLWKNHLKYFPQKMPNFVNFERKSLRQDEENY